MEIKIFESNTFGKVRTMTKEGKTWFIGKEIADNLGYANTRDAIARHVDRDDKADVVIHDGSQNRTMTMISESGMYALVLSSNLAKAKAFKRWVTNEVLPSIRKHGVYAVDELLNNPDVMIKTLEKLKEERAEKNKLKHQMLSDKPYTEFGKSIVPSKQAIMIGEFAKLLKNAGIDIGQNRLFAWLRLNGYLITRGLRKNQPLQKYIDQGLFRIKETVMQIDGEKKTVVTTLITGKGQAYFLEKLSKLAG